MKRRLIPQVARCHTVDVGQTPVSALETIQTLGGELGPVVVVDVGYNDISDGYAEGLDRVMRALLDAGVQHARQ